MVITRTPFSVVLLIAAKGAWRKFYIEGYGTDSLLAHIANSSSKLKRLGVAMCDHLTNVELFEAFLQLPLLEHLETHIKDLDLKAVGISCSHLTKLKLNYVGRYRGFRLDDDALSIAETMPGLGYLQLIGNRMSNTGLNAILDGCPHLEHLDLRRCLNINFVGDVEKRCLERVKDVRRPDDSIADYPFHDIPFDTEDENEDEDDEDMDGDDEDDDLDGDPEGYDMDGDHEDSDRDDEEDADYDDSDMDDEEDDSERDGDHDDSDRDEDDDVDRDDEDDDFDRDDEDDDVDRDDEDDDEDDEER